MKKISLILVVVLLLIGLASGYAGESHMENVDPYLEVYGYPTCLGKLGTDGFWIGWHKEGKSFMYIVEFNYNLESGVFEVLKTHEENCDSQCYLLTEEQLKESWENLLQYARKIVYR